MPRLCRFWLLSTAFWLTSSTAAAATASPSNAAAGLPDTSPSRFHFAAAAGKYPVGFRVVEQYDYARVYRTRTDLITGKSYAGERARPVQTLVWYPAASNGKPMSYSDYFNTLAAEDDFTLSGGEKTRRVQVQIDETVSGPRQTIALQEMARAMTAVPDAPAHQGRYPVLVYAPSRSTAAMENADLCEYLASHGYLVIASPSVGARSRAMTMDLDGLEAQAGDIAFLIAYARSLPQADSSRIGVLGFSWGGMANVLAAARDDRIGAVVSLDGSLRAHSQFVDGGPRAARHVTPARMTAPLLYMAARPHSVEALDKYGLNFGYSLMNRMQHADTYIMTMQPMEHGHFDAYQLRFLPDAAFSEYSRGEASEAYSWTARYVLRFLDAYLKGDAAGKTFLNNRPAANGVPLHLMRTDIRPAASTAPTHESLAAELGNGGFEHAIAAYDRIKARDAGFSMPPGAFSDWGSALRQNGRTKEAVEIFKLGVHVYPANTGLFSGLAQAHEAAGNRTQAIASYRRVLVLDPANEHVAAKLQVLAGSR